MKIPNSKQGERSDYVELRHMAVEIPVGTTDNRKECPFCRGGKNRDGGFSITRVSETEARYCCHRASCGKSGRIAAWGFRLVQDSYPSPPPERVFTPRVYTGNTGELGELWLSELLDRYGISREEATWANWREDLSSKRLVCPIFSPSQVLRGYELRYGKSEGLGPVSDGPKTSRYRHLDGVWMVWYRRTKTGPVLLVEDCISALKGSRHLQTAALMGSHVDLDHLLEAVEIAKDNPIFLALDRDATEKSLKFISQWRFIAPNFYPRILSKDLKYLTDSEILELVCT